MDLYATSQLLGMIEEHVETPPTFALDMFFSRIEEQEDEDIMFDKLPFSAPLAPFVSPNVAGKSIKHKGFDTKVFRPAYIKPKHTVSPSQARKRRPGEPITGSLSIAQRRDLYVAELLQKQVDMIERRLEWMAWSAMISGSVTVEGDDYPSVTVDFGRKSSHTELLSGTARWDQSGFNAEDFFEERAGKIQDETGFAGTVHIMTPEAWKLARKDTNWRETLDNRRQASGNVELSAIALGDGNVASNATGARYIGSSGDHEFWVFGAKYTNQSGQLVPYLPGKTCISVAPAGLNGMQVFGAIEDHEAMVATKYFPKMWDQEDPSKRNLMTQSAPLIVPGNPNAVNHCTVTDN
ncbi:major capsid protein E [Litorimonas taeanensis]|uniref:Major capsid protein E n=1 Tax=Litorimonas taeanensis TaxID=568099 RepID=A0A420WD50_9PROT|nr:major capsid protein [Litorimonas taeanensis]RKQ68949.1 major capsid protein E [Litorimonas taeanensis]